MFEGTQGELAYEDPGLGMSTWELSNVEAVVSALRLESTKELKLRSQQKTPRRNLHPEMIHKDHLSPF